MSQEMVLERRTHQIIVSTPFVITAEMKNEQNISLQSNNSPVSSKHAFGSVFQREAIFL
jgi:hypothetical protein